jgi:hypothetical protein
MFQTVTVDADSGPFGDQIGQQSIPRTAEGAPGRAEDQGDGQILERPDNVAQGGQTILVGLVDSVDDDDARLA